jgi:hypothetical protein
MARKCSVCQHPDIADIDSVLVEGGVSYRGISQKYLLSEDSLQRHRKNHLPKREIQAAVEERAYGHHKKLEVLEKTLLLVLKRRLKDEDDGMVLRAHGQLLRHYEFEIKLTEIETIRRELSELTEMIREREDIR